MWGVLAGAWHMFGVKSKTSRPAKKRDQSKIKSLVKKKKKKKKKKKNKTLHMNTMSSRGGQKGKSERLRSLKE